MTHYNTVEYNWNITDYIYKNYFHTTWFEL